ncbi:hypothetical protein VNI00_013479 [Paramarasmius palmivorus]|uniref:F-box domain-containing protein n=1 Tax=Paramarasmius palmivorus TaxID=297713 RepID=A0AAW0BZA1_9AGAR
MTRSNFALTVHLDAETRQLLFTNEVPTEGQVHQIRTALHPLEKALHDIHTEIANLRGTLEVLGQQRDKIKAVISEYHHIFSPIRRLPPCVLLVIFEHYVNSLPSTFDNVYLDNTLDPRCTETPWKLGQICRRWRYHALQTSTLWMRIGAYLPPSVSSGTVQKIRERLMVQVSRAKGLLLTVSLVTQCCAASAVPFLAGVASRSEKIANLRIIANVETFDVLDGLSRMVIGLLPSLEAITINVHNVAGQLAQMPVKPPTLLGFVDAPRLRDVTIVGDTSDFTSIISLPWGEIVRFCTSLDQYIGLTLGLPFEVIQCVTTVRELFIRYTIATNVDHTMSHLTLDYLQILTVSTDMDGAQTVLELLKHATFPSLWDFRISTSEELVELYRFLSRHSHSITSFSFDPREFDLVLKAQMTLRSLRFLPNLQSLTAHSASQAVVDALAERSDDWVLAPVLENLTFQGHITLEDEGRFLNMVKKRSEGTLRRLALSRYPSLSQLSPASLNGLQELSNSNELYLGEAGASCFPECLDCDL